MAKRPQIITPSQPSYRVIDRRNVIKASDDVWNHTGTEENAMRLRVTVPADRAGTKNAITRQDWEKQLNISRKLYARVPEISGAILQKSLYAIGDAWCPQFIGSEPNAKWGDEAELWLDSWFNQCDTRGEPYDFYTSLFLDSIAFDRDGDSLMITTRDEDGNPRLKFLPSHRIASRYDWGYDSSGYGRIPDGRFKGAKVYNGVIFSNSGRSIGINILGESYKRDEQIPLGYNPEEPDAPQAQFLYEPEWSDQGRGIPRVSNGLLGWMNYEDIHYFLMRQVKQDSAQGILHYNDEGAAEDSKDFIEGRPSGSGPQDVKIEKLEGNEIMYFKALGGGKIEPFRSDRPHPNVDAYTMRILRGTMQPLGWFYELYDPSAVGGASTRLIQDMARASIRSRQKTINKRATRSVLYGLSVAMANGDLPFNQEWMMWGFTMPAKVTVDARYDEKTWTERIRSGTGTYSDYYGEKGQWWEDRIRQRIKEQKFIEDECGKAGVDLNRVQLLTPNGNMPTEQDTESGQEDTKK
jgi:hypothetical protein